MRIFSKGVLILGLLSWLCTKAFAEPPAHVFVENFPAVQIIEDKNFKPRTEIFELEKVNVNTYTSLEAIELTDQYILHSDGFDEAVVSVVGFAKSKDFADCHAGVILVPLVDAVIRAWKESHELLLSEHIRVPVSADRKYFQGQLEMSLSFPKYAIGFYNSCQPALEMNFYAYLK